MKKKILAAVACAAMVLSLTACGKDEEPANGISSQPESTVSSSVPGAESEPATSSTPDNTSGTSTTPDQPEETNRNAALYSDEKDFKYKDFDVWWYGGEEGITITQYIGNDKVVNIPPTINGKKVVMISGNIVDSNGAGWFYPLVDRDVTDVNIPYGVTRIGADTFSQCEGLKSVTIPDSVIEIEGSAFFYCENLTSITIPNSITRIGSDAFGYCKNLKNVTISDNVTIIDMETFKHCTSLERITIPDGVTWIAPFAFLGCTGLTDITLPDSVTSIGDDAFKECTGLTDITLPDSVTKIGDNAFYGCENIKVTYKGNVYDYAHIADLCSAIDGY